MTATVDVGEVQGNVVRGYGRKYHWARFVFLKAAKEHTPETRAAVAELLEEVTFGDPSPRRNGSKPKRTPPKTCVNVSFTHHGLDRLGVPAELRDRLPAAFREGAIGRAEGLFDSWHRREKDVIELDQSELLLSVHALSETAGEQRCEDLRTRLHAPGFVTVHSLPTSFPEAGDRERFGFADGLSQPAIEGVDVDAVGDGVYAVARPRSPGWRTRAGAALETLGLQPLSREWRLIRTGEFLLGHENEDGVRPEGSEAPLGPNSTFMVFRQIEQNVEVFNEYVEDWSEPTGLTKDHLGAKIVGRWKDGTSATRHRPDHGDVATHPRRTNDFLYSQDPQGFACPLGAHTRRANPRDTLPGGAEQTARHRIIRRGMPYGPPAGDKASDEQGLAFICYCASIEDGFEYIQRNWINGGEAFELGTQGDFLLQDWPDGEQGKPMVIPGYRPHILEAPETPFVKVRACEYLFVPSRSACTWLSTFLRSR